MMKSNCMQRLLPATFVILSLLALANVAVAAKMHEHRSGKQLLGDNIKKDGHHEIHQHGKFHASVETKGGKIAAFHVRHESKGEIAVKKVKSHKKYAMTTGAHLTYAALPQDMDMGTVYIGYNYIDDDGNEETYWFPEEEIIDGDSGAVEYIPLSD